MEHCKHTLTYRRYDMDTDEPFEIKTARIQSGQGLLFKKIDKSWYELTPEEIQEVEERKRGPHYVCGKDCPERKKE